MSSYSTATWMGDLRAYIGKRKLTEICLPGAHDSAAYDFTSDQTDPYQSPLVVTIKKLLDDSLLVPFSKLMVNKAIRDWGKAQDGTVEEQLKAGVRWLDLRVMKHGGDFYHYHGFVAHKSSEVLEQVKRFIDTHPLEIVVLYYSHMGTLNTVDHHNFTEMISRTFDNRGRNDDRPVLQATVRPALCRDERTLRESSIDQLMDGGVRVVVFYDSGVHPVPAKPLWVLSQRAFYRSPDVQAATLDALRANCDAVIPRYRDLPFNIAFTRTPGTQEILASLGNQLLPGTLTQDLRWFTIATRAALPAFLASHADAPFGVVSTDFVQSSSLVSACIARTLRPPYSNGTRIENSGKVYLLLDSALRHVPDPDTYNKLFRNWDGIANFDSVDKYRIGAPLPRDTHLRDIRGNVYLIVDGYRRLVPSPEIFDRWHFSWERVVQGDWDQSVPGPDITTDMTGPVKR